MRKVRIEYNGAIPPLEVYMLTLVPWLGFLHTLSAITFFSRSWDFHGHGVPNPQRDDFARIRAMLDLSASLSWS